MSLQDSMTLFSRDTDTLLEKDVNFCYGMSKMPNQFETKEFDKHKKYVDITELLEMISRVAEFKYK